MRFFSQLKLGANSAVLRRVDDSSSNLREIRRALIGSNKKRLQNGLYLKAAPSCISFEPKLTKVYLYLTKRNFVLVYLSGHLAGLIYIKMLSAQISNALLAAKPRPSMLRSSKQTDLSYPIFCNLVQFLM